MSIRMTIEASISAWALAYGCDQTQFQRILKKAGVEYEVGKPLTADKAFAAVTFRSEKDAAIARQANAKAEEQEMLNAESRKELMSRSELEKIIWSDLLAPLRLELEQMPKSLSGLVNPADRETAEKVLSEWVEKTKSNIRPQ